tara:strand:- start:138 stop:416 length:279 start_codon:yes stop_codon:yes gene_type:complete
MKNNVKCKYYNQDFYLDIEIDQILEDFNGEKDVNPKKYECKKKVSFYDDDDVLHVILELPYTKKFNFDKIVKEILDCMIGEGKATYDNKIID